jgi:delta 1-pyrroline-5-carboxylate dehydrogenase
VEARTRPKPGRGRLEAALRGGGSASLTDGSTAKGAAMTSRTVQDRLFIGGDMVTPVSEDVIEVISPVTEERIGTAPSSTPADLDRAVRAARGAFDDGPWPRMSPQERADALGPFGEYLRARVPEIAQLITTEMGSPISFSNQLQAPVPVMLLDYYRELAATFPFEQVSAVPRGFFGSRWASWGRSCRGTRRSS